MILSIYNFIRINRLSKNQVIRPFDGVTRVFRNVKVKSTIFGKWSSDDIHGPNYLFFKSPFQIHCT